MAERFVVFETGTPQALRDLSSESEYTATRKGLVINPQASTSVRYANENGAFKQPSFNELTSVPNAVPSFIDGIYNGEFVTSVGSNAITISLKTAAGNDPSVSDPVIISFKSSQTSGNYELLTITSALSLTISSGSTLGTVSNKAFRIWLVIFNDAGTPRLGAIHTVTWSGTTPILNTILTEWKAVSSTAEGGAGAADSAGVYYTDSAVASKFFRILGYFEYISGLATAGTWNVAPDRHQLFNASVKKPGDIVQNRWNVLTVSVSTTAQIPHDNTIPLITEGAEVLTCPLTPINSCNLIALESDIYWQSAIGAARIYSQAVFIEGVTNAVAAKSQFTNGTAGNTFQSRIWAQIIASVETSVTYSTRAGGSAAGELFTVNFNFGGVGNSYMRVTEYMT
jgi:hypothetical protein